LQVANALKECPLTDRALALLIADSCNVNITQAMEVMKSIPLLSNRCLKKG
jgi:hypothetical protein